MEQIPIGGILVGLYVFVLAAFLGYHLITRVPPLLHTPLMSLTNAISGISLVGSIVIAGMKHDSLTTLLGFIAVTAASINVVGGFMITERMLRMFRSRGKRKE
jgi:NAD(P) transhydrogenase subunit alpha